MTQRSYVIKWTNQINCSNVATKFNDYEVAAINNDNSLTLAKSKSIVTPVSKDNVSLPSFIYDTPIAIYSGPKVCLLVFYSNGTVYLRANKQLIGTFS